ncbi:uncharacterized protein EAF02_001785 [Botrytis sinoallii]|uniref:uncharacterized protein n=1 Tax=Botrytis sinoallii TaxID=1463999 RepID=UPI001900FD71|nr:uncharacterized protein EAF02_001785 [Botrytis sinoallii]KAF7891460.1 hypothetical protein EAF02_001785 [Botrytis sinoallii]
MRSRENNNTEASGDASRTRESKKPATDSTKTGNPKASPSNPPASNSSQPSDRFITSTGNSRIHPKYGTRGLPKPSPGSFPEPRESPAASSSKSTKIPTTNASIPKPTKPPTVVASSSNSTSGSGSAGRTDPPKKKKTPLMCPGLHCRFVTFSKEEDLEKHNQDEHPKKR